MELHNAKDTRTRKLMRYAKDYGNTKREIKELILGMSSLVCQVMNKDIQKMLIEIGDTK